jgi:hypothetical protein
MNSIGAKFFSLGPDRMKSGARKVFARDAVADLGAGAFSRRLRVAAPPYRELQGQRRKASEDVPVADAHSLQASQFAT